MPGTHVLVFAKAPLAGRAKTRLCPPLSPVEAAAVAEACLADTLDAVARCGADRRLLALDGPPGDWLPEGFEVFPQVDGPLDERLTAAWARAGGPGLQIGMDTPQVTGVLLDHGLARLLDRGVDAVLGDAVDGGWWAIGLRAPHDDAFRGVPMSTPTTGRAQRSRLEHLGLRVADLPVLLDLDTAGDALALADQLPGSRTALAVRSAWAHAAGAARSSPDR